MLINFNKCKYTNKRRNYVEKNPFEHPMYNIHQFC